MNQPKAKYPKIVEEHLAKVEKDRAGILASVAPYRACEAACRGVVGNPYIMFGLYATIHLTHPDVGVVVGILRRLARSGFRQDAPPSDLDSGTRIWHCGRVNLFASFRDDGPRCRRVKVGERIEPIYEIQCDDDKPKTEED